MIQVNRCVLCHSDHIDKYPSRLSPFVKERAFENLDVDVDLIHCQDCDFLFYNPRLEMKEILKLYSGYRNQEYQIMRQKYEPGYTEYVNQAIGKSTVELALRKQNMRDLFSQYLRLTDIKSVLDYGGDKGQFILEDFCNAKKFVYEISNIPPCEGINSISRYEEISEYDLVMCCHVLEHESFPNKLMENIFSAIKQGGFLYLELPMDNPISYVSSSALKNKGKNFLWHYPTFSRHLASMFPQIRFGMMHEHINHFSLLSLERLVLNQQLKVMALYEKELDFGWTKTKILCCLAKRSFDQ